MTLAQALIALAEGKEVLKHYWDVSERLRLSAGQIVNQKGEDKSRELVGNDWELYEEPKKKVIVTEWLVDFGAGVLNIEHQLCTEEQAKAAWPSAKLTPLRSFEVESE